MSSPEYPDYTFTEPVEYRWYDEWYRVPQRTWRQLYEKVLKHAHDENPDCFRRDVLTLSGHKHVWFAKDKSAYGAESSVHLNWCGYYAEYAYSQHSANDVHRRLLKVLEVMRIPESRFQVQVSRAVDPSSSRFIQDDLPAPPTIPGVIYPTNFSWDTWAGKAIAHLWEQTIVHMQEEQKLYLRIRELEEQLRRYESPNRRPVNK